VKEKEEKEATVDNGVPVCDTDMIECFWLRLLLLLSFAPLPKHPTNQEVDETRYIHYGIQCSIVSCTRSLAHSFEWERGIDDDDDDTNNNANES